MTDHAMRMKALAQFAMATRERVEPQTFAVYLDDLAAVPTSVVVEACARLRRSATWFPKVSELLAGCSTVLREQEAVRRPRLPPADTPPPARVQDWLAKIQAAAQGKRMPAVDVPDEAAGGRTLRRVR